MPAIPAAEAVLAAAGPGADGMAGDSAPPAATVTDAREKAAPEKAAAEKTPRRSRARRVRELPGEPEVELATRPLAVAPPVSMPAAPGVPAAIFQAPA